jgi:hypothetical protein
MPVPRFVRAGIDIAPGDDVGVFDQPGLALGGERWSPVSTSHHSRDVWRYRGIFPSSANLFARRSCSLSPTLGFPVTSEGHTRCTQGRRSIRVCQGEIASRPFHVDLRIATRRDEERRMSESSRQTGQHPIGTLAIVGVYGLLFAAGWLLVYVYVYLSRGPVTP